MDPGSACRDPRAARKLMGAGVATSPHCPSRDYRRRDAMRPRSGLPGCGRDQARPSSGPGPVQAEGLGGSWFGNGGSRLPPVRRVLRSRSPSVPRLEMKQAPSLALRNRIRGSSSRRSVGARSAVSPCRCFGPKPFAIGDRLEPKQSFDLTATGPRSDRSASDRSKLLSSALARIEANSDPCPTGPRSGRSASGRSRLLPQPWRRSKRTPILARPNRNPIVRHRVEASSFPPPHRTGKPKLSCPQGRPGAKRASNRTLSNEPGGDSPCSSGIRAAPPCPRAPALSEGSVNRAEALPVTRTAPPGRPTCRLSDPPPIRASAIRGFPFPATK